MLLSGRLDKFVRKKSDLYNFRCPYCGDSQKHRNKARGYFFRAKADMVFKCHNCGVGRTLPNFLKDQAPDLYDEYIMERYKKGTTGKGSYVPKPKFKKPVFKKHGNLERISSLNIEHVAHKYITKRGLDPSLFYYTKEFCTWVNTQKPTFTSITKDHPRIIIPFIDSEGEWFGFQGRALNPKDKLRYITVMLDENKPKIYGLNRINPDKKMQGTGEKPSRANILCLLSPRGFVCAYGPRTTPTPPKLTQGNSPVTPPLQNIGTVGLLRARTHHDPTVPVFWRGGDTRLFALCETGWQICWGQQR